MAAGSDYDIKQVQEALNRFGYGLKVDGLWGPKTEAAVKDFQGKHNLKQDGYVGPLTWGALNNQQQPGAAAGQSGGAPGQDANAKAAQQYPQYAWALNDPELGPILRQAAGLEAGPDGLTASRDSAWLQGRLYGTNWWKTHSDSARSTILQQQTDPASYQQNVQGMADRITGMARELGLGVRPETFYSLAEQAIRLGWTDQQIREQLTHSADVVLGPNAPVRQQLAEMSAQYGIPLSEGIVNQWWRDITAGSLTMESFQGWLKEQAAGKYPSIAKQIGEGITPVQIAGSYIQQYAQEMGLDPNAISITDPKFSVFFYGGENGTQLMSLWDWQKTYRNRAEYGWDKSQTANDMSAGSILNLEKLFGKVG